MSGEPSGKSATSQAYDKLKQAILSLELLPGQQLAERSLEQLLESSRTPIRAALVRLETEGLVRKTERSYIVVPIEVQELEQAFAFRALLERESMKLAATRVTPHDVARLQQMAADASAAAQETTLELRAPKAEAFHLEFARIGGNAFVLRALEDIMRVLYRARWMDLHSDTYDIGAQEHHQMIDLVADGRGDEAAEVVEAHIAKSRDRLLGAIKSQKQGLRIQGLRVVG